MKLVFFLPLLTCVAFAQTSRNRISTKSVEKPASSIDMVAQGVRVGVFKANYEGVLKYSGQFSSWSFSDRETIDLDTSNGLAIGYAAIPIRSIGFDLSMNLIELIINDRSANTVRANTNATYGFTKNVYSKIGLNYTKYVGANTRYYDGDVGYQLGLGYQVTPQIGMDLTMSESKLSYDRTIGSENMSSDFRIRGLEVGLTGTF